MKKFALIGAAGYVAPRHMKAIKETGNTLLAAYDIHDSVGILDSYFPQTQFFTEFERFDRYIHKISTSGQKLDYLSVCSPNYLHDAHCRYGLRNGIDVICEKPLVLNPWNLDALQDAENQTGRSICNLLQLRLHPTIIAFKNKVESNPDSFREIDLSYCTSRGDWYFTSWKGDDSKSGGIATNIGVHFFDMLCWIFGSPLENEVHIRGKKRASGCLEFAHARVRWFLSIDYTDIPDQVKDQGRTTYRSLTINEEELEFSEGFADLHTQCYSSILNGNVFRIEDVRPSIQVIHDIRNAPVVGISEHSHPFVNSTKS